MKHSDRNGLAEVITESALLEEAGDRAYERGLGYFHAGAVTDLVVSDDTINARVVGGDEYAVQLWNADGELGYSCTCPVGDDGVFCKHGVAAGLAWLARQQGTPPSRRGKDDLAGIREWLAAAPREQLEKLLLEQALNDPGLRGHLDARAARTAANRHVDAKTLKDTVGKALAVSGFVDYQGMRRLIERVRPVTELLAGLIEDGHADMARELAHYALRRGIATYQRIDDSGGSFGELLHQIAELHLKACRVAPPEPAAFGKQLFELAMLDDWDLLAFADYAPLLGVAGLRTFRALAEKEWSKIPARGPGDADAPAGGGHYRITAIMEALARQAGDVDALVAIMSRNLSYPYHFLQIAEVLAEAGRRDEALDWAERGHQAFPDRPDSRLTGFLTDEYDRRGRHDEAVALAWEQFQRQPALDSYQHLKRCCKRPGNWDEWRARALAWLREEVLNPGTRDRRWSWIARDHSLLVEILLWESDSDAALAEAKSGGCHESLWFAVAKSREAKHPDDAISIYQARLDTIVSRANNRAYDEAATLVARIRDLMRRTKQEKEFAAWLEAVRLKHRAKRNFMQRLEKIR